MTSISKLRKMTIKMEMRKALVKVPNKRMTTTMKRVEIMLSKMKMEMRNRRRTRRMK